MTSPTNARHIDNAQLNTNAWRGVALTALTLVIVAVVAVLAMLGIDQLNEWMARGFTSLANPTH